MNVWIVSFDDSEDGSDPQLSVFSNRARAAHYAATTCIDSPFYGDVVANLAEIQGGVTLNYYEPDDEEHLRLVVHPAILEVE